MPHITLEERQPTNLVPGIDLRTFWGENMMLSVADLEPGAVLPPHSHPHEKCFAAGVYKQKTAPCGETSRFGWIASHLFVTTNSQTHPQGKQGVNISRPLYDTMRAAIIEALEKNGILTFAELTETVRTDLGNSFDGSINWYVTTVKLDLEARDVVERIPKSRPQKLRLVERWVSENR
jgi:hypothetical protein